MARTRPRRQLRRDLRSPFGAVTLIASVVLGLSIGTSATPTATPRRDDVEDLAFFESQVRPLLVTHCVDCHGGRKVRSGLSLIDRDSLVRGGERGPAVDEANPEKSVLLAAIEYRNDLEMPPTAKLPPAERAILSDWIKRGTPWTAGEAGRLGTLEAEPVRERLITDKDRDYWAYRPVVRPTVPSPRADKWSKHGIDAFIASRVESAGLSPSPLADDVTLLRRATYDLTGLPPTRAEVAAYLADTAPEKWERLIDRLLESPQYGEKWGRYWLDLVRYAETNGYERDSTKVNMWRYRDYVIRSFNSDKPYDQFIIEQIAGDELPGAGPDERIATGFHRLPIWDDEPIDRNQSRADVLADIIDVTTLTFLGTTVGCARCHDHKKDPITQRDYYRMMAFFNNLTDHGTGKHITRPIEDPQRPGETIWSLNERTARLSELDQQLQVYLDEVAAAWAKSGRAIEEEERVLLPTSEREKQTWRYTFDKQDDGWEAQGFDASAWKQGPGGFGRRGTPASKIGTDWTAPEIYLRRSFRLTEIPPNLAIRFHHDDDVEVYINGVPVFERDKYTVAYHREMLTDQARDALVVGSNTIAVHCVQDFGGQYIDVGLGTGHPPQQLHDLWIERLKREGRDLIGADRFEEADAILTLIATETARPVRRPYPAPIAFERSDNSPKQFIHLRGNANVPGDEVTPGFPEVLGPAGNQLANVPVPANGAKSTGRRLVLARWIASRNNPVTARVMVNRIWQFHFGRGIVRSPSDFGQLGTGPTHPKLLDFLASEFMARDWSIKQMHRFIMSSRAYRMTSKATAAGQTRDPNNDLFWRFDMRRLTAEEIRDSVLAVNATLNRQMFGPSIYTKLPREVLETSSRPDQAWGKSPPDQQDRRSIYVFVKRSLRESFLETFDQADTDSSCAERFVTNVPTQTLTMLNSAFLNEESGVLADHLLQQSKDLDEQIRSALQGALARPPLAEEVERNVAFVRRMRADFGLDERESLRLFSLSLYNLNEFLFLD